MTTHNSAKQLAFVFGLPKAAAAADASFDEFKEVLKTAKNSGNKIIQAAIKRRYRGLIRQFLLRSKPKK